MATVFTAIIAAGIFYSVLMLLLIWHQRMLRKNASTDSKGLPAISIFKPLKGIDDDLELNLDTFFRLEYPKYQLVFGVQNPHDPAVAVVRKLIKAYPHIDAMLVQNHKAIGLNPKVNNLNNMYPKARHDYLLISDSNVAVPSDYLTLMMRTLLQENMGLVSSAIRGIGAKSCGAAMENLHLNSYIAGSIFAAEHLARTPIVVGKSMLFARSTLERIGGFAGFANVLAEDHLIGEAVQALGMRVTCAPHSVDNINRNWSVERFFNRHARWARMRRYINPPVYFAELLVNPVFFSAIYASIRADLYGLLQFFAVCALKIAVDTVQIRYCMQSDLKWYHYLLLPVKDMLIAIAWFVPFFNRTVTWRGNEFRITSNTRLVPMSRAQH